MCFAKLDAGVRDLGFPFKEIKGLDLSLVDIGDVINVLIDIVRKDSGFPFKRIKWLMYVIIGFYGTTIKTLVFSLTFTCLYRPG